MDTRRPGSFRDLGTISSFSLGQPNSALPRGCIPGLSASQVGGRAPQLCLCPTCCRHLAWAGSALRKETGLPSLLYPEPLHAPQPQG